MTPKKRSILTHLSSYWLVYLAVLLAVVFITAGQAAASADLLAGGSAVLTADDDAPNGKCDFVLGCPPPYTPTPVSPGGCSVTSVGLTPLMDMGGNQTYQGFPGRLYPFGNNPPTSHMGVGLAAGQAVGPLNPQGQPDNNNGRVVLLALGMSNVKQEFGAFIRIAGDETAQDVVLVNGGQPGYDSSAMANPNSDYWDIVDERLNDRDVTRKQVQVIWLKGATAGEDQPFPQDALALKSYLRTIVLIAENRYPNLQAIYFSSRIYAGYAGPNSTSPEPFAYQGAFAIKWLLEEQINGTDPALAYSNTPWLAWGPYMWADGLDPRSDGLTWSCGDFADDGIHPSATGEEKVAQQLKAFFEEHPTTNLWFVP